MFTSDKARCFAVALTFAFLAAPGHALAYVLASSDLTLSNLRFSFSDPGAEVSWTDVWFGQVQAQAQDTDSGVNGNSKSLLGNDGRIGVPGVTQHVHSAAGFAVLNGADADVGILAITHSQLELIQPKAQGDGFAASIFNNYFIVIDPDDPDAQGPIDVLIEMDYSGNLHGEADKNGLFTVALRGLLQLDDLSGAMLGQDLVPDPLHSGTNNLSKPFDQVYAGSLGIPVTLNYGAE